MPRFSLLNALLAVAIVALIIQNYLVTKKLHELRNANLQLTASIAAKEVEFLQDQGFSNGTGLLFSGTETFMNFEQNHSYDEITELISLLGPPEILEAWKRQRSNPPPLIKLDVEDHAP